MNLRTGKKRLLYGLKLLLNVFLEYYFCTSFMCFRGKLLTIVVSDLIFSDEARVQNLYTRCAQVLNISSGPGSSFPFTEAKNAACVGVKRRCL